MVSSVVLTALLLVATAYDLTKFRIPNMIPLVLVGLFILKISGGIETGALSNARYPCDACSRPGVSCLCCRPPWWRRCKADRSARPLVRAGQLRRIHHDNGHHRWLGCFAAHTTSTADQGGGSER